MYGFRAVSGVTRIMPGKSILLSGVFQKGVPLFIDVISGYVISKARLASDVRSSPVLMELARGFIFFLLLFAVVAAMSLFFWGSVTFG
jgi:hypothetical protein